MNERTVRDRMHALGPLVLRVGIALVLLQSGLQYVDGLLAKSAPNAEAVGLAEAATLHIAGADITPERVNFSLDWRSVLGIGELGTACLLFIGLFTRLAVMPMLVLLIYGMTAGFPDVLPPANPTTLLLLGVAGLSLFVTGGGCLCLGRRRCVTKTKEMPPARDRAEQPREFVRTRQPLIQRVREWFARRRSTQPVYAMPLKRRRWWT